MADVKFEKYLFQFLIGTIKTRRGDPTRYAFLRVSIPYRYDKNFIHRRYIGILILQFQFLIGTIKTTRPAQQGFMGRMFQFLIGTIKTWHDTKFQVTLIQFQFLIGTIKTAAELEPLGLLTSFNSL